VVLLNTICATQDIVTNAYAVTHLQGKGAGAANAIQVAGFIGGMLCGGGGLLVLHQQVGWSGTMLLLAALLVLLYLPLACDNQWHHARPAAAQDKVRLRDLRRHPDLLPALIVALLFKFASTAVSTLMQPWLVDRGMDSAAIGTLQMAILISTALGGVVLGIPLVRRCGNVRAVWIACALAALVLGAPWLLLAGDVHEHWAVYAAFCVQGVFEGSMYVAIWAMFMNWADPARPGTDYTAMQCCESLANALAAGAVGGLGQALGYADAFAVLWAAGAVMVLLIALALRRMRFVAESVIPGQPYAATAGEAS
jgi:PAT family beta-lactamase induction signal transducer AmpG